MDTAAEEEINNGKGVKSLIIFAEELKAENQMEWVRCVQSIHNRAEEIVLTEMVYV